MTLKNLHEQRMTVEHCDEIIKRYEIQEKYEACQGVLQAKEDFTLTFEQNETL
jgi:hypothetical protein